MAGFGRLDWSNWLYGLFAGFIGGGASAVVGSFGVSLIDTQHFNIQTISFYKLLAVLFLSNGFVAMFAFLKQNSLPQRLTTTTAVSVKTGPDSVTTTISEKKEQTNIPA